MLDTPAWHSLLHTLAWHSWHDTLAWHFCWTLLARHSCWTLLTRHSCLTLLLDTLTWHSCLTLLLDTLDILDRTLRLGTLAGHSLLDTVSWHSCWTLLLDTLACLSCQDTLANQTSFHNKHFPRDFHQKWQSKLPNRRFPRDFHQKWLSKLPKRAFYTRLSPKVTSQASKTSVLHETFTKSDNPSFQNERFTRDFHQKWQSKLPKQAFYTRLSPKVTIQASKTSVLHETSRKSELRSKHSALQIPMEQRDSTPREHHSETANPNITATQTSHFHETLRLCSEITFFNLQVYNVRRLPRKMSFVTFPKTCKIVTLPSVWNDFDHFCSHTFTAKSTFYLRLVTKTELFKPPCNCKSQWNSAIQHH